MAVPPADLHILKPKCSGSGLQEWLSGVAAPHLQASNFSHPPFLLFHLCPVTCKKVLNICIQACSDGVWLTHACELQESLTPSEREGPVPTAPDNPFEAEVEAEENGTEQQSLPQPETPPEFEASQPAVATATIADLPARAQPQAAYESAAAAELADEPAPVAELASVPTPAEDVIFESAAATNSVPAPTTNLEGLPPTAAAAAGGPPPIATANLGPGASVEQPLSARIDHDGGELPAPRCVPLAAKENCQGHCAVGQLLQHVSG